MNKYVFLVFTDAVEGREDDYNDWYTNQHLGDVVSVPGFVAAQRFRIDQAHEADADHRYLAIYEIEADDVATAQAALKAAAASGAMPVSDALDPNVRAWYFQPITERVTSSALP